MATKEVLLFAVDGIMVQCELARQKALSESQSTAALDAITASVVTLRELLDTSVSTSDTDGCTHPQAAQNVTLVPGGRVVICTLCNEIIEQ